MIAALFVRLRKPQPAQDCNGIRPLFFAERIVFLAKLWYSFASAWCRSDFLGRAQTGYREDLVHLRCFRLASAICFVIRFAPLMSDPRQKTSYKP